MNNIAKEPIDTSVGKADGSRNTFQNLLNRHLRAHEPTWWLEECPGPRIFRWSEKNIGQLMVLGQAVTLKIPKVKRDPWDPNTTLLRLHYLHQLNLTYNDFYGFKFHPSLSSFTKLAHPNLSNTFFRGFIPLKLSYLSDRLSHDISYWDQLEVSIYSFNILCINLTKLKFLFLMAWTCLHPIYIVRKAQESSLKMYCTFRFWSS